MAISVFLVLQKIGYQLVIMQQVFEWLNYTFFIRFQASYEEIQLAGVQSLYLKYEQRIKWLYLLLVLPIFIGLQLSSQYAIFKQASVHNDKDYFKQIGSATYTILFSLDLACVLGAAYFLKVAIRVSDLSEL